MGAGRFDGLKGFFGKFSGGNAKSARRRRSETRGNSRLYESGNVFFTLFGAVAVVGVLGAGIMSTMRGPLSTMVEVNRIEETKAEMAVTLRLILLKGSQQDGDTLTEPTAPASCTTTTGAGCVPSNVGAKTKDAWGTSYAYCAWNNGSEHNAIGGVLAGEVSTNNVAVALISAGPDRTFDTDCQANPGSGAGFQVLLPDGGGGDDIVRKYNYNDAVAGSDGLWALQDSGPTGDFARVEEEISVGGGAGAVSTFEGGASFGSNIQTEGDIRADVVGPVPSGSQDFVEFTNGILLGDTSTCTDGMLRINAGKLQLCMGGGWDEVGKALWIEDANGMRNDGTLAPHVGIGTPSSSTYSLYVNGGTATDTLKATGIADLDATLNVDGAVTLHSTVDVDGAATLNSTLAVTGDADLGGKLDVANTTDMHGDLTVESDVFIKKTGGTKGNLTVDDKITATGGDITATAGNVVATAGDVVATAGDVQATVGNVTAGKDITAQDKITATAGDITATAGKIVATAGDIEAVAGKIIGESFHRGDGSALDFSDIDACDPETEKTVWSTVSGWTCEPDNGTGTGTAGESTLQDVLGRGNDAEGQDAEDFGKIGADEYCDAGLATCVSTANLIAGSSIWKNDGPGAAQGEIYYNGGFVGIGTNDPTSKLEVVGGVTLSTVTGSNALGLLFNPDLSLNGNTADEMKFVLMTSGMGDGSGGYKFSWRNADSSLKLSPMYFHKSGNIGIGHLATLPKTALEIAGTLKIGDGTELCNSTDHEGALKYDAAGDNFYMCRSSATGWELLGSGSGSGGSASVGFNAFTVSSGVATLNGTVIRNYGSVSLNAGAGFNNATGIFTAPEAGLYVFGAGTRLTDYGSLHLVKSGTGSFVGASNGGPGEMFSASGAVQLAAGDQVVAAVLTGSLSADSRAHFWGMKISGGSGSGSGGSGYVDSHKGQMPDQTVATACNSYTEITNSAKSISVPAAGPAVLNWSTSFFGGGAGSSGGNFRICWDSTCSPDMRGFANEPGSHRHVSGTWATNLTAGTHTVKLEVCNQSGTNINFDGNDFAQWSVVMPGGAGSGSGAAGSVGFAMGGGVGQALPADAWTTVSTYATEKTADLTDSTYANGVITIGPNDAGWWAISGWAQVAPGGGSTLTDSALEIVITDGNGAESVDSMSAGDIIGSGEHVGSVIRKLEAGFKIQAKAFQKNSTSSAGTIANARLAGVRIGGGVSSSGGSGGGSGQDVSFMARSTAGQAVAHSAWAKVTFNQEEFDNGGSFASNKFQPTAAGSYVLTANVAFDFTAANANMVAVIYKNGAPYVWGTRSADDTFGYSHVSALVKANGTSDYFEVYAYQANGSGSAQNINSDGGRTYFSGALIGGGSGTDTLAGLSCTDGQVAAWDDTAGEWACSTMSGGGGGGGSKGLTVSGSTTTMVNGAITNVVFAGAPANNDFGAAAWSGNSSFTVPAGDAGWYVINGTISTPNTMKHGVAYIRRNGSTIGYARDVSDAASSVIQYVGVSAVSYLAEGDVVNLAGNHATGSDVALTSALLSLAKIGGGGGDTLAGLSCTDGQVAAWDDTAGEWACADMGSGGGGAAKGFAANSAVTQAVATGDTIAFGTEWYDTLNGFNPATGIFTAPETGLYDFSAYLRATPVNTPMGVAIYRITPSSSEICASTSATATTYARPACSGSIQLNAGETVKVVAMHNNGGTTSVDVARFSGVLIGGGSGSDTLAGLSCMSGQIAKWNGSAWACAADNSSGGSGQDVSFSAHKNNVDQTVTAGVLTKLTFSTERFDTNGNFDTATSRFTPAVAGKYTVNASALCANTSFCGTAIYKNGALYAQSNSVTYAGNNAFGNVNTIVDMNGTTDYLEAYVYNATGTSVYGPTAYTYFLGALIGGSGSGDSLWSDSGNGYIEYNVASSGVKVNKITGLPNPDIPLASGLVWDADTNTLQISGNVSYTGTLTDASDRRLKTEIEPLIKHGSMLEKIRQIDTYSFVMKDSPERGKEFGVIAQQLETIFPELVDTSAEGEHYKSVNYLGLIAPVIEAAKELDARNEQLQLENAALWEEIGGLRANGLKADADMADLKAQVALLSKISGSNTRKAEVGWPIVLLMLFGSGCLIFIRMERRWNNNRRG